jgi:hypothetical protein
MSTWPWRAAFRWLRVRLVQRRRRQLDHRSLSLHCLGSRASRCAMPTELLAAQFARDAARSEMIDLTRWHRRPGLGSDAGGNRLTPAPMAVTLGTVRVFWGNRLLPRDSGNHQVVATCGSW